MVTFKIKLAHQAFLVAYVVCVGTSGLCARTHRGQICRMAAAMRLDGRKITNCAPLTARWRADATSINMLVVGYLRVPPHQRLVCKRTDQATGHG